MLKNYSIRELSENEFKPFFDKQKKSVFEDVHSYDINDVLSDSERKKTKKLG